MPGIFTKRGSRGFTLVETMVTLVILSVGMLALGTFYVSVMDSQHIAQERLMAVHLAEQVIEDWQKDSNDRLPNISGTCVLSTRASTPTYPVTVTCTPSALPVAYTIWSNTTQARAPLPTNPNNGGVPLAAPNNRGAFAIDPLVALSINGATTVTPMLKVVKVTWSHKGVTQTPIVLTHISRLQ